MSLPPQLLAQLAAAKSPDDPAFPNALKALQEIDPRTLDRTDLPTLIALLDSAMEALKTKQNDIGTELSGLRTRAMLNAYSQNK